MHIVEDEEDNMLDVALGRMELTLTCGHRHKSLWCKG
jgi:hypothetical protein